VCDWTRARGREKFAFPRLSTATDEKKSHTRRVGLMYKLTYIVVMIINNNNNNNNDRRLTMGVAMLVDWRFFSAASSARSPPPLRTGGWSVTFRSGTRKLTRTDPIRHYHYHHHTLFIIIIKLYYIDTHTHTHTSTQRLCSIATIYSIFCYYYYY